MSFLGLMGSFPTDENGSTLRIRLTGEKTHALASGIKAILGKGRVSRQELEGFIGKLSFSKNGAFFLANSLGLK